MPKCRRAVGRRSNLITTILASAGIPDLLTSDNATSYYYPGDRLVAMNSTGLRFIHHDHLTGTAVVSSDNGTLLGSTKYYPYGVCRNSQGNLGTDKLFTGQRLDDTGLYYYNARYYDAEIGRFISADTVIPHPFNPQSLNRYSYVLNNPLKYIDPTGYDAYSNESDCPVDIGSLGLPDGSLVADVNTGDYSMIINGQQVPIDSAVVDALIGLYSDPTANYPGHTWSEFIGDVGLLGSPASDWGLSQLSHTDLGLILSHSDSIAEAYTRAGIMLGVMGGGTARLGPAGVLIYEGIQSGTFTDKLMDFLHAGSFTIGNVILTRDPNFDLGDLLHELGHKVQYDTLGGFFLPAYGIGWLIAFGQHDSHIMEQNGWLPQWGR